MENVPTTKEALEQAELKTLIDSGKGWVVNRWVKPIVFESKDSQSLHEIFDLFGVEYRYNTRQHVAEIMFPGAGAFEGVPPRKWDSWVVADTRVIAWLRETIASRFRYQTTRGEQPLKYGDAAWNVAFNAMLCETEVDPFKLWLEELPEWDKTLRIETMLQTLFGCEDTALNRWASSFLVRGPVQRAYQPGAKLDSMPVLIGAQGIGKSALCKELLPPEFPTWHADGLHLAAPAKDRAESLQGRVIVEASEMAGASRADLESLKAFLTRTDDGTIRLAYRAQAEYMPRLCIFIGTSNDPECLPNDPSGLRRFVPVILQHGANIEAYMREHRRQLWAEAMAWRDLEGLDSSLPRNLIGNAAEQAEQSRRSDEIIEYRLADIDKPLAKMGMSLDSIADAIGLTKGEHPLDMRQSKRLGNALRTCGWSSRRVQGKRLWFYHDA